MSDNSNIKVERGVSAAEMNADFNQAYRTAISDLESNKARRTKLFENETRKLDGKIRGVQNHVYSLERKLSRNRAWDNFGEAVPAGTYIVSTIISTVILVGSMGLGLAFVASLFIAGGITLAVCIIWGIVHAVYIATGQYDHPSDTEKEIQQYMSEIAQIERMKSTVRQTFEQEIAKVDTEITELRRKLTTADSSAPRAVSGGAPAPRLSNTERAREETSASKVAFLAQQGDVDAQFKLAGYYDQGIGVKANPAMAFKWHQKAAEQGHVGSQCMLGIYYLKGIGTTINNAQGIKWLKKASARGYDRAQFILGMCYLEGTGVKPNQDLAVEMFRKAADQGHTNAQEMLMSLY